MDANTPPLPPEDYAAAYFRVYGGGKGKSAGKGKGEVKGNGGKGTQAAKAKAKAAPKPSPKRAARKGHGKKGSVKGALWFEVGVSFVEFSRAP